MIAAIIGLLGILLVANRWKTAEFTPVESEKSAEPMQGMQGDGLPQQEISRIEFLNAVFEKTKPSPLVTRILTAKPGTYPKDSLELALRWAEETSNVPLVALLQTDLAEQYNANTDEKSKNVKMIIRAHMESNLYNNWFGIKCVIPYVPSEAVVERILGA